MRYKARHAKKSEKNHFKKSAALLIALALIVTVGVGSTLAYLINTSSEVTNTFLPTKVACEVHEDSFNGATKTNVSIKNTSTTGDVDAYIRATVVVTWKDTAGNVYGQLPVKGTDYTLNYATKWEGQTGKWLQSVDDYYYWTTPVEINACTGDLIDTCTSINTKTVGDKTYYLSVEIVAEAIQAKPITAVTSSWASGVSGIDDDGTTLLIRPFTQQ